MKDKRNPVQIDEYNLDRECISLSEDYLQAAVAAADAKRELGALENELSVMQADIGLRIRKDPASYGLEKVTESSIQSMVLMQTGELTQRLADARHDLEIKQALVWAMEHKKRALTLLVELHGMGYFSAPKISKKGKEAVEEMTKKSVRRKFMDD